MNQFSAFQMQDGPSEPDRAAAAPSAAPFRIARSGMRPLAFEGTELCMAMSYVPGAPNWYEINIYRTTEQKFVVAVRLFFRSEDERDRVRAWEFESFDQVLDCLEGYDAATDVRIDQRIEQEGQSAAELAAHAFLLRARAEAARSQYAGLVGEILHELEQG